LLVFPQKQIQIENNTEQQTTNKYIEPKTTTPNNQRRMKFISTKFSFPVAAMVLSIADVVVFGVQGQPAMRELAETSDREPPLASYTGNPNSDTIPMVSAPRELVGSWQGSNCGLNDPQPVVAGLEMAENGANVWSFADADTGTLLPQTGDGIEVVVGWQCIDVGKGYWWGQVPYSDVLWCNLFQVEEVESDDDDDETTLVSYINLAYGGQGVGALSEGACPTNLSDLETLMKPLQASFTKRVDAFEVLAMTCDVPAGSPDREQPSFNSQFPGGAAVPNPFGGSSKPVTRSLAFQMVRNKDTTVEKRALPVMSETTCRINDSLDGEALAASSAKTYGIDRFANAAVLASVLSWMFM
jgi:hypothetical protein